VPVQVGAVEAREKAAGLEKAAGEREGLREIRPGEPAWEEVARGGEATRVIKIPADKFLGGDPRYNVVVRPGDSIHVPLDIVGRFYIMGNTNFQGFVDLTGEPMTLKQAIASAGGLGPLAWPRHCEVTRRLSKEKEEIVMVDLEKIFRGEQPDFYIKPMDTINVGTHVSSRWRAVLRNAFRATYGFGFIYDRNFADRDYGTHRPIPDWF
jgi:polysaccharide export outer membrane protein